MPFTKDPREGGVVTQRKDLTGKRFDKWLVIRFAETRHKNRNSYWLCRCDCGKEKAVAGSALKNGDSTSCGCNQKMRTRISNFRNGSTLFRNKMGVDYDAVIDRILNEEEFE
jgi:hypothetical protein